MKIPRYDSPNPYTTEGLARVDRLITRATEVFGDDDWQAVWWYQPDPKLGLDEIGATLTPARLAAQSEEGLQRLLVMLDELALTVTPKWKAPSRGRKSRRR